VAVIGGVGEGGVAVDVSHVYVGALGDESLGHWGVARGGGYHQRCLAEGVDEIGVHPFGKKQLHDVFPAIHRRIIESRME